MRNNNNSNANIQNRNQWKGLFVLVLGLLLLGFSSNRSEDEDPSHAVLHSSPSSTLSFHIGIALAHHPPSLRIFRALLQVNLILWGAVVSWYIWRCYFGAHIVRQLWLLECPTTIQPTTTSATTTSARTDGTDHVVEYELVQADDNQHQQQNQQIQVHKSFASTSTAQDPEWIHASDEINPLEKEEEEKEKNKKETNVTTDNEQQEKEKEKEDEELMMNVEAALVTTALDMLLLILFALHVYYFLATMAIGKTSFSDQWTLQQKFIGRVGARIVPLILFVFMSLASIFPWTTHANPSNSSSLSSSTTPSHWERKRVCILLWTTLSAPWHPVTFRDGFVGDVLTSAVRPLQDIALTIMYLLMALQGVCESVYASVSASSSMSMSMSTAAYLDPTAVVDRAEARVPQLEKSWFYYTILLPMCAVSPLWWRYLQNLRQAWDGRIRWPVLGNALKYFCAAQVAVLGIFFPSQRSHVWWLMSFVLATLYQIYWDIFMDWNLFESRHRQRHRHRYSRHREVDHDGWSWRWRLRSRRIYPSACVYWIICGLNIVLRFGWTLTFLPSRYYWSSSSSSVSSSSTGWLYSVVASAEIIRRTLWGLLRFEWEVIKDQYMLDSTSSRTRKRNGSSSSKVDSYDDDNYNNHMDHDNDDDNDGMELTPMKIGSSNSSTTSSGTIIRSQPQQRWQFQTMSPMTDTQILMELSMWATAFAMFGVWAAAHRETP